MRRAVAIQQELDQIHTVEDLTGIFESVASIKIAQVRNRVIASKEFFNELWQTYRALRVDPHEQLTRANRRDTNQKKPVLVAVTTEGKLSGDIGNKVIDTVVSTYGEAEGVDVIVLGAYGAVQLAERGVVVTQTFHLPDNDAQLSVAEVITALTDYGRISVIYQTYESLRVQKVAHIELISAIRELSDSAKEGEADEPEVVSSHTYIFEPGITEIADYLESLMMGVALTQILMESQLAQYAGRFNAMNAAKHRAREMSSDYSLMYHRAKRAESDERLKEVMKVLRGQAL